MIFRAMFAGIFLHYTGTTLVGTGGLFSLSGSVNKRYLALDLVATRSAFNKNGGL